MTQEDKELLLQDLCARLYCGVKAKSPTSHLEINTVDGYFVDGDGTKMFHLSEPDFWQEVEYFQYYLRPMSSMTKEEVKEFYNVECMRPQVGYIKPTSDWHFTINGVDWLNAHHFDYRRLIEKGLVLEAPEGMY